MINPSTGEQIRSVPMANWLAAGQFKFTPGGQTFIFGRLVQEGIVARFLADRCPSPIYRLCNFRDHLPTTADDWIWHSESPFLAIGGWEGGAPEMARIIRESLTAYPVAHLISALGSTWEQFYKTSQWFRKNAQKDVPYGNGHQAKQRQASDQLTAIHGVSLPRPLSAASWR